MPYTYTPLPIAPNSALRPTTFASEGDTFFGAMGQFQIEMTALAGGISSVAAGGAMALPYTVSLTTTDADPGPGFLRLSNATQNASTVLRLDLTGADGITWSNTINTFDDSTSTIKGQLRIVKNGDATKFLLFNVLSLANPTGYFNITIANVDGSSASPFAASDSVSIQFTRTGDLGSTGAAGSLVRRVSSTTSSSTPTPNFTNYDMFVLTAQAATATFAAPTGTGSPADGQGLLIRIKDSGASQSLLWNAIYRASTDLALPTATVISKTLYVGFIYNAADSKWDIVGVLGNI